MSASPLPQPASLSMPPRARAGDALTFTVQDLRAASLTVTYVLTSMGLPNPTRIQLPPVVADSNGVATFTLGSAATALWLPGRYQWVCFATDSFANRTSLAQGETFITPDPAGANPADPRSYNEKLLDQLKAVQANKALDDVTMYKIGERELTKLSPKELREWIAFTAAAVRRERRRRGERVPSSTLGISFGGR